MNYKYVAYTSEKPPKMLNGSIDAPGEEEAVALIESTGCSVLKIDPVRAFRPDWARWFPSVYRVKPEELIVFSRQLKLLTEAGSDIVTSLELLLQQMSNKMFKKAVSKIISDVRSGSRVADAMSSHPAIFPKIYCRSIGVGEQTGEIGLMLEQTADYIESESKKSKGLKSALMYPMVVSFVALAVAIVLILFVLPTIQGLYSTLNVEVPAFTKMLLTFGELIKSKGVYIIGFLVAIIIGTTVYFRTPAGKYIKDKMALTLPLVGLINRFRELAYSCRTMSVLFRSGLTSTEVMDMAIESSNNRLMIEALSSVKEGMLKGEGLSKPMADNRLFLPMMVQMVRIGEETGGLGATLTLVADTYDAEADGKTRTFVRFVQTVLTIGISVMVFTIVLAMMMAMYGIYGQME